MDSSQFLKIAESFLQELADEIENANDEIEVDYLQGILTITLADKKQYVLNKHEPTKQIWLSSPFSGAHRFELKENKWINKDNISIFELLTKEFL